MDFKNIPNKYRPVPFWSWNERLDIDETSKQVRKMHDVGIGGFFMHARGGLQTEYMGKEWFENIDAAVATGEELGMYAWAYDENGWPSGFGNGVVNGLGVEYQQKYLRMSDTKPTENIICKSGNHWFYYEVNPYYVDVLDKKVIAKFIEVAYEPYYERYKGRIEGIFTDEPQSVYGRGLPWSFVFEEEYQNRYGENLLNHLEELLLPVGDYKNTRVKFWKMMTELFCNSYSKQIYDWCDKHGLKLTGHLGQEESMLQQITLNGACMPHYEYYHIPGMDWLRRTITPCLTPLQVSSVADQTGKKQILSESFALSGHDASFAELKGIFEWHMSHGITLLCQHLEGYSIRGLRKRDHPPAVYYQQPWWSEYCPFIDALSREGMLLTEGERIVDVLLLHPITTAWSMFDTGENKGLKELDQRLLDTIRRLEEKHIIFHLGDEIIIERHARVENGKLVIGKQSYSYIIDPGCEILLPTTQNLITEFEKSGGKITTVDDLPENHVIDRPDITYTKHTFKNFVLHYFVNTSPDRKTAKLFVEGRKLDIYTGDLADFDGTHEFEPWGSLMIIDDGTKNIAHIQKNPTFIRPEGEFKFSEPVLNTITLDRCDYYFDGKLQEKNCYVLNICERANRLERPVKIHQDYFIKINHLPDTMFLVCETPEIFNISINGKEIDKKICGYFRDKSFKKIDIAKHIKIGENTISFDCSFAQSEKLYKDIKKAHYFESEKNKLAYDMEIEPIYLLGDFCVKTDGKWVQLEREAFRYIGRFELDAPKTTVNIKNIEQQGYPFFCGSMTLEGEIDIHGENPVLDLDIKGIHAVKVTIGGITKTLLTDNRLPLLDFGVSGKTKVTFTLINNLRNLLGPHHLEEGESHVVCPFSFHEEEDLWKKSIEQPWNRDYCFVETGI